MPNTLTTRTTLRLSQYMDKASVRPGRRVAITISVALFSLLAILVLVVAVAAFRDFGA